MLHQRSQRGNIFQVPFWKGMFFTYSVKKAKYYLQEMGFSQEEIALVKFFPAFTVDSRASFSRTGMLVS